MDISNLHTQLRQKQLSHLYIFTGPEWAVQNIYINQIAKTADMDIYRADNFAEVFRKAKASGLLSSNHVYVVRDDKDVLKEEKAQKQLDALGNNILILLFTTVDKRTKFYKTYKSTIVEFEALQPKILAKYIAKEINLSDKNVNKLMEVCEYSYGRCLLEVDKILSYVFASDTDNGDKAFVKLLADGTIYQPPKDAIFDFVDAVLDADVNRAYDLYNQCLAVGEAVMVMLTVLYNNAKAVLQVQSYVGNTLSKSTGLTGWQIKNAKPHCDVYTDDELIDLLRKIQKCESGIKTGRIEEQFVMDYILTTTM